MAWMLLLFLALLILPMPAGTPRSDSPPVLIVTVRDAQGHGIPGVQVSVREHRGAMELGRAATDAAGMAVFATLPTQDVRVAVAGQLPGGPTLRQIGNDAHGIALTLSLPPNTLDLRVEPDGIVIPDPTTMIALDLGIPIDLGRLTAQPTVPTTGAVMDPTMVYEPPLAPSAPHSVAGTQDWIGIALALVLTVVLAAVAVLAAQWRNEV